MKSLHLMVVSLLATASVALAQTDQHQGHHPAGTETQPSQSQPAQAQPAPSQSMPPAPSSANPPSGAPPMQMMGNMPDHCRRMMQNMMQNMPQDCMRMMQDGMMKNGMMKNGMGGMERMPDNAMKPGMASGPISDATFVSEMIVHHQASIDMANAVLKSGTDKTLKKMAQKIVRDQTREIKAMQDWQKKHSN